MRIIAKGQAVIHALFVVALTSSTARGAEELADLIERAEKSVVRINVHTADGDAVGSGFLVADGKLATNFHVVQGAREATAELADGTKLQIGGYYAFDAARDVTILATEAPSDRRPFRLAAALPRKGERVVAIGAPKGLSFSSSDGIVAAVRGDKELEELMGIKLGHPDMTWIQTTAPISPGNSGGPLINMQGEIVGMNTMGRTGGQNLNFAVSAADIRRVLDKGGKVKSLAKLPKSKVKDDAETPVAGVEGSASPVATLPSGKVLDLNEIFLAGFRNDSIYFRTSAAAGTRVTTFKYPNGNVSTMASETQGVIDGQLLSAYETGEPATLAMYSGGLRQGNLLAWDEQGNRVLYAQYFKDKPHGLVCLFVKDRLRLVQEADRGRIVAQHVFEGSSIAKSYAPGDKADKRLEAVSAELTKVVNDLHEREVKAKKAFREVEHNRRKAAVHANNLVKRGVPVDGAIGLDGAGRSAVEVVMGRLLRGLPP